MAMNVKSQVAMFAVAWSLRTSVPRMIATMIPSATRKTKSQLGRILTPTSRGSNKAASEVSWGSGRGESSLVMLIPFLVHPFHILEHLGVRWLATALAAPNRPIASVIRFRNQRLSAKAKAVASYRTPRHTAFRLSKVTNRQRN
jgi:hypothetical protein